MALQPVTATCHQADVDVGVIDEYCLVIRNLYVMWK